MRRTKILKVAKEFDSKANYNGYGTNYINALGTPLLFPILTRLYADEFNVWIHYKKGRQEKVSVTSRFPSNHLHLIEGLPEVYNKTIVNAISDILTEAYGGLNIDINSNEVTEKGLRKAINHCIKVDKEANDLFSKINSGAKERWDNVLEENKKIFEEYAQKEAKLFAEKYQKLQESTDKLFNFNS
jgi:hypothetical protein